MWASPTLVCSIAIFHDINIICRMSFRKSEWHSFNLKHCARRLYLEYRNEHVVKDNMQSLQCLSLESYFWALTQSLTFSVLGYKLFQTCIPKATWEELSNQHRSKKIVDITETKETELNALQHEGCVQSTHIYASGPESQILLAYLLLTPDPTLTPLFATPITEVVMSTFAHTRPHNAMHSPSCKITPEL